MFTPIVSSLYLGLSFMFYFVNSLIYVNLTVQKKEMKNKILRLKVFCNHEKLCFIIIEIVENS